MEQRVSLITLGVEDLDRATSFYEALGWKRSLRRAHGVAFFQLGGIGLSLFPLGDLAADAGIEAKARPRFSGIALAHNVRHREQVDGIVNTVVRIGGRLVKAPEEKSWGGYSAYVADPEGHLWEIAWNPFFPISDAGDLILPD